ncbi:hypothetical protein [Streptomyces sp. MMG1121]|uniref:hypothetical protein n=1 Tax=Streptomyces sp. MMG1121 TaxID=1415544 RepID=UPI0006AF463D|nr:hypothetical protein [Streptomyces sp. MMG1121]KOV64026.1 hypothetical protein ADK64_17950 [Streptomyces sp. MMG1121]
MGAEDGIRAEGVVVGGIQPAHQEPLMVTVTAVSPIGQKLAGAAMPNLLPSMVGVGAPRSTITP